MKPNKIITISSIEQFHRWWSFFKEGLEFFRKELRWEKTEIDYYKMLLNVVTADPSDGLVIILIGGTGQPYGYLVAVNNTNPFSKKSCNVYSLYTNNKCPSTFLELSTEAEQWARSYDYQEVQACSHRVNSGAIRWFQKKMKYTSKFMVFTKKL